MKIKRIIAVILTAMIGIESFGGFSAFAVTKAVTEDFNNEGLWLTEIYQNDIDRSIENNTREAEGYESINLYNHTEDLMEFIELTSTHSSDILLNDNYEIYKGENRLTVTDMEGNSDITVKQGQVVVLWNYRSDLPQWVPATTETLESTVQTETFTASTQEFTTATATEAIESSTGATEETIVTEPLGEWINPIPDEMEFRKEMGIPESAIVVKVEGLSDWENESFTVKTKSGKTVSEYSNTQEAPEGLSVELKIPDIGSEMLIYREKNLPTAGYTYYPQLNGIIGTEVPQDNPKGVFITEIRGEDSDRSDVYNTQAELMECVEFVNTTDSQVVLNKEYQLFYSCKEGFEKPVNISLYENNLLNSDCVIPAGGTAVLWCINKEAEVTPTIDDFYSAYQISREVPVFVCYLSLENDACGLKIYKSDEAMEKELVSSAFILNGYDFARGNSAILQVNPQGPHMLVQQANADTEMGTVTSTQYEYTQNDGSAVTVTAEEEIPQAIYQGEDLYTYFRPVATTALPRTAITAYYRIDGSGEWQVCGTCSMRASKIYQVVLSAELLFGHSFVEFYIKAENRYRSTFSGIYKVSITGGNDFEGIRTNISQGEEIRGTVSVTANDGGDNADTKIYIDDVLYDTVPMLEDGGWLTFTTQNRVNSYKGAITTADNKVVSSVGKWKNATNGKESIQIDNSYFAYNSQQNTYDVTLRFSSGSYGTIGEDYLVPDAVFNSYDVTNIKLVLINGNSYLPVSVVNSKNEQLSTDENTVHSLSKQNTYIQVRFSVSASEVTAVGTEVDTTALSNGEHILKVTNGKFSRTVKFIADNTAPVIKPKITNNSTLTGTIKIAPNITDDNTLREKRVLLDGVEIETPYSTTAYSLGKGQHTLEILAVDMAGNESLKTVKFTASYTDIGVKSASVSNLTHNSGKLNLNLKKANLSAKSVFYKASKISKKNIQVTKKAGTMPYIQYTVTVGDVGNDDEIILNWQGSGSNTDDRHTLKMYVLNVKTGNWEMIGEADSSGTIDKAVFTAKNHISDSKATVLVQCTEGQNSPDLDSQVNQTTLNENWDGTGFLPDYDFAFAWETDTQYYSKKWPAQYRQMNRFIANNAEALKIKYLIHTGDLVEDHDLTYQWENANSAMELLEKKNVPYGVLAGNHDVASGLADNENYWAYFGENRFSSKNYYGGSYKNNLGHYDLISENGQDFIIVYMSWNIYQEEIDWLNSVLEKYSDRKAILCVHSYLKSSGSLDYFGKMLQSTVVAQNPNVFAVLNGHSHGSSYQTVKFDDDGDGVKERTVYQLCTDYQNGTKGGNQYFKMLYFDLENDKIYLNSYSPSLEDFNYFDSSVEFMNEEGKIATKADCGVMEVDFDTTQQTITGKSFSAYVSKNEKLGTATANAKGKITLSVKNLTPNKKYIWYASITGTDSGELRTEFYDFTTLKKPVLSAKEKSLSSGKTYSLTVENAYENTVTYSISKADMQYIRVSQKGKITALQKTLKPAVVKVKVGKETLQCKVTVKNSPTLTDKNGKTVTEITLKKGKQKKLFIKGKAVGIKNVYKGTKNAVINGKPQATTITVKAKKVGSSVIKIKVNKTCTLSLKVTVKK